MGQLGRALRPSHPPPPSEGKLLRPSHPRQVDPPCSVPRASRAQSVRQIRPPARSDQVALSSDPKPWCTDLVRGMCLRPQAVCSGSDRFFSQRSVVCDAALPNPPAVVWQQRAVLTSATGLFYLGYPWGASFCTLSAPRLAGGSSALPWSASSSIPSRQSGRCSADCGGPHGGAPRPSRAQAGLPP